MFFHNFIYTFKTIVRTRSQIMWSVVFIIALGSLFYAAFGNLYSSEEMAESIKTAAIIEDEELSASFTMIAENVTIDDGKKKLLDVSDVKDMEKAKDMLEAEEIEGIFYSEDGVLKLLVKEQGINESILSSIVSKFYQITTIVKDAGVNAPDKVMQLVASVMEGEAGNTERKTTDGNMDVYVQYFYNLIAMACLMAVNSGIQFTVKNQANLSALGARKTLSGANSFTQTVSGLLASFIVQTICAIIGFGYLVLIGVKFGGEIGRTMLAIACGCICGVSMGYFLGSLSKFSQTVKESIGTAVVVGGAFLSGLMIGNMRMIVEDVCPIINKINPSALVTDAFYALNMYDTYDRYNGNILTLLIISVIFVVLGTMIGRRKQYASL